MNASNTGNNSLSIELITRSDVEFRLGIAPKLPDKALRAQALVLHGRSEFIEKYTEIVSNLTARGVRAWVAECRAHGLSGGRPQDNPQRHHIDDFSLLADDADAVAARIDQEDAGDAPRILLAHSMGGLIAALHLARRPRRYAAAILCAPMFGINTRGLPQRLARWVVAAACALGFSRRYAFSQGDYDPAEAAFTADNRLTGDPARYAVLHDAWRADPRLRLGGVTFGWLAAAFHAMDAATDGSLPLDKVETPVLILRAPYDLVVDADAVARVARRFPNARVVDFPDAKHELLMERDAVRNAVWRSIDAFLAEALPRKSPPP